MKRVYIQDHWPDSWKYSYAFDLQEIYGEVKSRGYVNIYENRKRQAIDLLTEVLSPGSCVLDIGAAQGNFSLALAEIGFKVTWNDLREDLAGYVRLKHEHGDIRFAPGNAFEVNFPELFDAVLITEIIEHVAHPDAFLAKMARLVKPSGYIVMTTPNGAYFRNKLPRFSACAAPGIYEAGQFKPDADGHIFLLYPEEIQPLASRAGLEIDKMVLFTNPLTGGGMKTGSVLRGLPKGFVSLVEAGTQWLPFTWRRKALFHMGVRFRRRS